MGLVICSCVLPQGKEIDPTALFMVQLNGIGVTSYIGFIRSNKVAEKAGAALFSFRADCINTLAEGGDSNDTVSTYQHKISNDIKSQCFKSKELQF